MSHSGPPSAISSASPGPERRLPHSEDGPTRARSAAVYPGSKPRPTSDLARLRRVRLARPRRLETDPQPWRPVPQRPRPGERIDPRTSAPWSTSLKYAVTYVSEQHHRRDRLRRHGPVKNSSSSSGSRAVDQAGRLRGPLGLPPQRQRLLQPSHVRCGWSPHTHAAQAAPPHPARRGRPRGHRRRRVTTSGARTVTAPGPGPRTPPRTAPPRPTRA